MMNAGTLCAHCKSKQTKKKKCGGYLTKAILISALTFLNVRCVGRARQGPALGWRCHRDFGHSNREHKLEERWSFWGTRKHRNRRGCSHAQRPNDHRDGCWGCIKTRELDSFFSSSRWITVLSNSLLVHWTNILRDDHRFWLSSDDDWRLAIISYLRSKLTIDCACKLFKVCFDSNARLWSINWELPGDHMPPRSWRLLSQPSGSVHTQPSSKNDVSAIQWWRWYWTPLCGTLGYYRDWADGVGSRNEECENLSQIFSQFFLNVSRFSKHIRWWWNKVSYDKNITVYPIENLTPELHADCLFTVLGRDPEITSGAVVGSMVEFLYGPEDPTGNRIVDRLADPKTRIVTLTVTEKGYEILLWSVEKG